MKDLGGCDARNRAYLCNKAVAPPGYCRNEDRLVGIVFKGDPNLTNTVVQPLLEVHKGLVLPEHRLDFFTGNEFAGPLNEQTQNLGRLRPESDGCVLLPKFSALKIELVCTELDSDCSDLSSGSGFDQCTCCLFSGHPSEHLLSRQNEGLRRFEPRARTFCLEPRRIPPPVGPRFSTDRVPCQPAAADGTGHRCDSHKMVVTRIPLISC